MIVGLIAEVGTPEVINLDPLANAEKSLEQLPPVAARERRPAEQLPACHHILVFQEKRLSDERSQAPFKTQSKDRSIGSAAAQERPREDIRVYDDRNGHVSDDSIYATIRR